MANTTTLKAASGSTRSSRVASCLQTGAESSLPCCLPAGTIMRLSRRWLVPFLSPPSSPHRMHPHPHYVKRCSMPEHSGKSCTCCQRHLAELHHDLLVQLHCIWRESSRVDANSMLLFPPFFLFPLVFTFSLVLFFWWVSTARLNLKGLIQLTIGQLQRDCLRSIRPISLHLCLEQAMKGLEQKS